MDKLRSQAKILSLFGLDALVVPEEIVNNTMIACSTRLRQDTPNRGINVSYVEGLRDGDIPTVEGLFSYDYRKRTLDYSTNPFAIRPDITDADLVTVATLLGGPFGEAIQVKNTKYRRVGIVGRQSKEKRIVVKQYDANRIRVIDSIARVIIERLIYQTRAFYILYSKKRIDPHIAEHIENMSSDGLFAIRRRRLLIAGSEVGSADLYNKYMLHLEQYGA